MAERRADRTRLDEVLTGLGLAPSRARARDAILRGAVRVDGRVETRPGRAVGPDAAIAVDDPAGAYVSRAALKLAAGLDAFGFDPAGVTALDLGASTGGFTELLLARGAARVIAIEVGHGQLHPRLAGDRRVILIEGLNARDLKAAHLGGHRVAAVVADLSFISLKLALPPALALAEPGAWGVFLVKPQFEVGRAQLGKGGIVRDAAVAGKAAEDIAAWLATNEGWHVVGLIPSPIEGGSGNREFLLGARRG
jgi:23S rRNA (cytidine1920-2'-O)/16S rRNA (cytidine1409-2'-O)-methyltransferase